MNPANLVLRCYARKRATHWEAFCIDLCLAAQGDTFAEARNKLDDQMVDYVNEALTIDKDHAEYLLSRKAPFKQIATYYLYRVFGNIGAMHNDIRRIFTETLPVLSQKPKHA